MKSKAFSLRIALCLVVLLSSVLVSPPQAVKASASGIVISQIYGGGGNAGATFKNDFIEIFNADGATVNLNGWSVQYASAAGTTWQVTALSGSLAPGQYFLIQESQGAGGTTNLPTPNAIGNIAMSATAGKVALVSSTVALTGGCPVGGAIVDFVGYGTGSGGATCFEGTVAAPTLTNTTADFRRNNGLQDTDNNSADFVTGAPNPRNQPAGTTNPTGSGAASPASVAQGGTTLLTVLVTPGANPTSTGIVVTGNLSSIGGSATEPFFDDGTNGDVTAGNNTFSFSTIVTVTTTPGSKTLPISISDAQGRSGSATITLTVTAAPLNLSIHDIQGPGDTSPVAGRLVSTTGIVTGVKSNGFFIQNPDNAMDADPNSSEGVFVFTSSRPAAVATVGNLVQVTGTVQEFIPSSDPNSPPSTEIAGSPTISLISTGNPLPTPITLTTADTNPAGPIDQLEKYEGMRVHVDVLNVTGPTDGNLSEANATATSNGIFYGVLAGIARPFREPGVQLPDPLPPGAPANVPRFDTNPELIRVDSDALGATAIDVTSGATVTSLTGPLDFASRSYTILVDPDSGAVASGNVSATPVPVAATNELTIANFNMERFFDTVNDPGTSDVALTATAFANRLNKASLAIRTVLNTPDIIGIEEMENLNALQALADKVNADAVAAGQPAPNYHAFLIEGNDVGGIDAALLVKDSINVISVEQVGKDATFIQPDGTSALLNDRPPLVLTATASQPGSDTSLPFTMVVNHLRSLLSIDDPVDGARVRAKRQAQAEFLANLLQSHQAAGENVVSVCDCNAFEFSDGYVDILGTILGRPAPADQVVNASPDLIDPDFTDLVTTLPHDQQYSFVFNGSAQVLDHIVVSQGMLAQLSRFAIARNDADFPEVFHNDPNRPERLSDHDMPVAYFTLPEPTPPVLHLPANITAEATSAGGAVVSYDATATDARDTNVVVTCAPASGSLFSLGLTTVNCSATNSRHKTAEGSFSVTVVDTTAPVVTLNGVTNGATYTLGAVPAASCSTTDSASGVAIQATLSIVGGTVNHVGHFTATCSGAKDVAGNLAAPVSASYDVHYVFSGFLTQLSPDGPDGKTFRVGSTIPVKWQLQDAQGNFIVTPSSIGTLQVAPDPSCIAGQEGLAVDANFTGNGLKTNDDRFQFNWKTTGLSAGCYAFLLPLDDGTINSAVVKLR
jgi:predicted extracellular nuclease